MVATTKTASRPDAATAQSHRSDSGTDHEDRTSPEPLPDVSDWIRRTVFSGDGSAVPPGVAMMRANPVALNAEKMLDGLAQMHAEMARFGAKRFHRALEAQAEMLACRSSSELRAAQKTYFDGLARDYTHEWTRLFGYGLRVGMGQPVPPPPDPGDEQHATPV